MKNIWMDLRFGLRQLKKSPGFTAVAVLSLALGIAGTTVMFGVLDDLLLRPPSGVHSPNEVARLYVVRSEGVVQTPDGGEGSYLDFESLRNGTRGMEGVAAFLRVRDYDDGLGVEARRVRGRPVSGNFFSLLGVMPARGRLLIPDDDRYRASDRVAVLSDSFWRRRFGAAPDVVGTSMVLNGEPFTVVGVAGPQFTGLGTEIVDVWVPLGTAAEGLYGRANVALLQFLARVDRASDWEQVRVGAETALARSAKDYPRLDPSPGVILGPLNAHRGPRPSGTAQLSLGLALATAMILLIACANVANLLLARTMSRRGELAVRNALGAGQRRIVAQLLTESVLLGLLGGLLGLVLAFGAARLVRQVPEIPPYAAEVDLRLAGFAFVVSLLTALVFGLAPSILRAREGADSGLRAGHSDGGGGGGRLPIMLVTVQVALSVVLLLWAGFFVRALQRVITIDPGIDTGQLAVASLDLRSSGYEPEEMGAFYARSLARLRALPGIEAASVVMPLPLGGGGLGVAVLKESGGETVRVPEGPYMYVVEEDFFRTAGIRILRGRPTTSEDRRGSEPVAVVSDALANALARDGDAVGLCVPIGGDQVQGSGCTRIVGVAANVRRRYLVDEPMAFVYRPASQLPFSETSSMFTPDILVRTEVDPGTQLSSIRSVLQGIAQDLPYIEVRPLDSAVGARVIRPFRIAARLLSVFGFLALVLAAVGLYGSLSHLVAARTREVGLRMALGADRSKVLRLVFRRAMLPVCGGLVVGLAAAAGFARLVAAESQGLSTRDPVAVLAVVVTLLVAALFATWLPARRAAGLDPMESLRSD